MRNIIFILFIASLACGCSLPIRSVSREYQSSESLFEKNYTIDKKQFAYVGHPIITVKNYNIWKYKARYMRSSDDFKITGGMMTYSGKKDSDYPVVREITLNSLTYPALCLREGDNLGIIIKDNGNILGQAAYKSDLSLYNFTAMPTDLKFTPVLHDEIDSDPFTKGFRYELLYGGTDGKSFFVTYREFVDDMAQPATYQNLTYEAGKKQIRFKDFVIQIHEATNERIVYTVTDDGLKGNKSP